MMIYTIGQWVCQLFFTMFIRAEVKGKENIPEEGPVLLCSNHISNFDPPLIGTFLKRKIRFMAKEELFHNKLLGFLLSSLGAFPVKRGAGDRQAIRKGLDVLKKGEMLCLFPEGTRSKTGKLGKPLSGSGFFALRSEAVIVPVVIIGPYKLFRKVTIIYGKPIHFEKYRKERVSTKEATDIIMTNIQSLLERHQEENDELI